MGEELYRRLASLSTEAVNPETKDLDRLDALGVVQRLSAQDALVPAAVAGALPEIAAVAEMAAQSLRKGGRLIYLGAGTSGRLGVLDAAECPPTFGTEPWQVQGIIAGGPPTLLRSREGIEDDTAAGAADLEAIEPHANDTVVGISACHRTPYTVAGIEAAERRGCQTAFITCNADVSVPGRVVIRLLVGPEAIAGSTRLKAGSAQKMTLNLISSTAMVLIGKVFGNRMVDLRPLSAKLIERSRGVVMDITGLAYGEARALLARADGEVKTALLMHLGGVDAGTARRHLAACDGHLRRALASASDGESG